MVVNKVHVIAACLLFLPVAVGAQPAEQLRQAAQYEKTGHLDEALEIYLDLLETKPGDVELLAKIQGLYAELKRYPQLIELLNGRLARDPGNFALRVALGEAFFLSGRLQQAKETWFQAIQLAPREESSYMQVSNAFLERGMLAEAEEVLQQGRKSLEDETLFADRLARLYELRADYRAATLEYINWIRRDVRGLGFIDTRLAQYPQDAEVTEIVGQVLSSAVAAEPDQISFRQLYGHYLLRNGEPDRAYDQFLILNNKEKGSNGKVLLLFARRCAELGYHAAAIRACHEVAASYPDAPTSRQALLWVGENLLAMGQYQEALAAYGQLAERYPTSPEAAEALYARGEIHFIHLNDVDGALAAYRILAEGVKGARLADAAFRVGDCLVVKGDLEEAWKQYDRLAQGLDKEEVRERAAYKLAELALLQGKFEEAGERFDELVQVFPQGFFVNDALVWSMFLDEGLSGDPEPLQAYVSALRRSRQRDYEPALGEFQGVLQQFPETTLGADILLRMALLREKIGQHRAALADLEKLLGDYPESRLCPEALRRIGEIYELRLEDLPRAIEAYEQVLSNYPRYLFLDQVRRNIRRLKGEGTS